MSLRDLLQWYNLVFVAPLLLSVVLFAMTVSGLGGGEHELGGDHDADVDADHEVDLGHEVSVETDHELAAEHDADVGHEADVDHDADTDADHDAASADQETDGDHEATGATERASLAHGGVSVSVELLSTLGIGKVPLSFLAQSWLLWWAVLGLCSNRLFAPVLRAPEVYVWPAMGIALCGSLLLTRLCAEIFGKYLPTSEMYVRGGAQFIGAAGLAVYEINQDGGVADVYDDSGTLQRLVCRTLSGSIPAHAEVVVVDYETSQSVPYVVEKLDN